MSTNENPLDLPQMLPEGLLLRWATPEDTEELAAFNLAIHSDDPDNPETFLLHWTRDLMSGRHPTTNAGDCTVVVDTQNDDRIVSTLCLISQAWAYDGIHVPVGRPELVATLPEYRRRGLVRRQMDAIHALSAARGELMTVITGIPWYYRQFGYEMAVDLGGSRQFFWARPGNAQTVEAEPYTIRPATTADIAVLQQLHSQYSMGSLLARVRPEAHWRFELEGAHPESSGHLDLQLIESPAGEPIAYASIQQWGTSLSVLEFGVAEGHSWRAAALYLTRELKRRADELNAAREQPITNVNFVLGTAHPLYVALGNQLERQIRPYAYYIRVPDVIKFLHHITPVLESRVAASVLAGHTGTLKVNLYRERFDLVWEEGKLKDIAPFEVKRLEDGDVRFPDLTFLQILLGYRSYEELHNSFADCYASNVEARLLTEVLFPKRPSTIRALD